MVLNKRYLGGEGDLFTDDVLSLAGSTARMLQHEQRTGRPLYAVEPNLRDDFGNRATGYFDLSGITLDEKVYRRGGSEKTITLAHERAHEDDLKRDRMPMRLQAVLHGDTTYAGAEDLHQAYEEYTEARAQAAAKLIEDYGVDNVAEAADDQFVILPTGEAHGRLYRSAKEKAWNILLYTVTAPLYITEIVLRWPFRTAGKVLGGFTEGWFEVDAPIDVDQSPKATTYLRNELKVD